VKGSKGASHYSSIDTFAFSSAGSLDDSLGDNKLEGFGGGTPSANKKKDDTAEREEVPPKPKAVEIK
jgi:hypothetical protein